jgi:two-component system invasion response regulator UvrY
MIRLLIADDHAVVREGIKRIIADTNDITVAGEAADGQALLAMATNDAWDVVLMDLAMPGLPGLEVLQEIRNRKPKLPVLVLSMRPEDQYAVRTLMAGASGYINKGTPPDELVTAIRTVADGRRYITPEVAESLASHVDAVSAKLPHESLSNREYQVMCLIAAGKSVGDIAEELLLSVKTVSTYRRRLLDKLRLRHNAEITRYVIEHGLAE